MKWLRLGLSMAGDEHNMDAGVFMIAIPFGKNDIIGMIVVTYCSVLIMLCFTTPMEL